MRLPFSDKLRWLVQLEALGLAPPQVTCRWMTVREWRRELLVAIRSRVELTTEAEELWATTFLRPLEYLARPLDQRPMPSRDHTFATMLRVWG